MKFRMKQNSFNKTLLLCPSVGVWQVDNALFFDRKFYDGLLIYSKIWPGQLKLLMSIDKAEPPQFGLIQYDVNNTSFQLDVIASDELIKAEQLQGVDAVMGSADDFRQAHLSTICNAMHIKCIYVIEYILETRIQIANLNQVTLWKKYKSIIWLILQEIKLKKALKLATGIQANGIPAYKKYAPLTSNSLLYFDTRNSESMLITPDELESRLTYLDINKPLRLGFSGRLIAIKGAMDLIEIAHILDKNGVHFSFDIFGSGDLQQHIQEKITHYHLQDKVILHGAVDYATVLVPFVKSSLDIFVCCHKQSDPSCTYLETYACGVPILGYANRAHTGILKQVDVGWSIPMNNTVEIAKLIEKLDKNRLAIKLKARASLIFAQKHTFEKTFEVRMQQFVDATYHCNHLSK